MNSNSENELIKVENSSPVNIQETQAIATVQNFSLWKKKVIQTNIPNFVKKIYFADQSTGFMITANEAIYKSSDGGISWKKINSPLGETLFDICFVSPKEGFVISLSGIIKTDDGGQTWRIIHNSNSTNLMKIAFDVDGLGVVVGRKDISTTLDTENYVLLTNDFGNTWTDISGSLNQVGVGLTGQVGDDATDVVFSINKGIIVLTLRGRIYSTLDKGKSWNLISKLLDEPNVTGIRHFGELGDGQFWMAGGTTSIEGKWGMVAVMNDTKSWEKYRLTGYNFSDVEFLSNNEVFACGSIVAESNFGGNHEEDSGVILHSVDRGKTWTIMHKSNSSFNFSSISRLSNSKILVAGGKGELVFLELGDS